MYVVCTPYIYQAGDTEWLTDGSTMSTRRMAG